MTVPWPSWMRGVSSAGTIRQMSHLPAIRPPSRPVRPMVSASRSRAASRAAFTLSESPDVDSPITASPSRTNASTCLTKMSSTP